MGELVETHEKATKPASERRLIQKRSDILHAATALFATRDYHTVLMDEVAEMAGVGKGTLYRYFEDKEALFAACVLSALDELVDFIHTAKHDETLPYRERLKMTVLSLVKYFAANNHFFRVMHHEKIFRMPEKESPVSQRWEKLRRIITHLVEGGTQAGEFRSLDSTAVTTAVLGVVRAFVNRMGDKPPEEIAAVAASILIDGIAEDTDGESKQGE